MVLPLLLIMLCAENQQSHRYRIKKSVFNVEWI